MIVEARALLLADARSRVDYAAGLLANDLADVAEPFRTIWLRGRGRLAARLLAETLDLLRIAETKR